MTTQRLTSVLALIALVSLGGGCGKDRRQIQGYFNNIDGFGVIASDPYLDASFVDPTAPITLQFNEAVDEASLANGIRFTRYASGNSSKVVTDQLEIIPPNGSAVLTVRPKTALDMNVCYGLMIVGVKSVSGRSMFRTFDLRFSTGAGCGGGYRNDPDNPPKVIRFERDIYYMGGQKCLGVSVWFNEDLIENPQGRWGVSGFLGLLSGGETYLDLYPAQQNRFDYYWADFGCGCDYFNVLNHFDIKITEARDFSEQYMSPEYHNDFGIPVFEACSY